MESKEIENLSGISTEEAVKNHIHIVGYMIAFTFGECAIPNEIVSKYWEEHELDKKYQPNPSKPKGAFKKASSFLNNYREREWNDDRFQYFSQYTSTKLLDTQYMITRKIIKVSEDETETELEHDNLMKLNFDTVNGKISYELEDSRMAKVAIDLFNGIFTEKYNLFLTHMTRENLHDGFKRYLLTRNAVPLTIGKGGAWFIPAGHEAELEKIKMFFNDVANQYTTGIYGINIRTIPLIDNVDVVAMVEESVQKKIKTEMEKVVTETLQKLNTAENMEEIIEKTFKIADRKKEKILQVKKEYERILKKKIAIDIEIKETIPVGSRIASIMKSFSNLSTEEVQ